MENDLHAARRCRIEYNKKETIGRILSKNSRSAGLFEVEVKEADDKRTIVEWQKKEAWRDWTTLSEGCYLLRTNVSDWSAEDLWHAYIQLTEGRPRFEFIRAI